CTIDPVRRRPCVPPRLTSAALCAADLTKGRVMNPAARDAFGVRQPLAAPSGTVDVYRLDALASKLGVDLAKLPFSIRVLLEAAVRTCDDYQVTQDDVKRLARWQASGAEPVELPFKPARVILQDLTGVPCVVDLAAMREAVSRMGADAKK